MRTSRTHAVLFTKEACAPCIQTKEFVYDVLEENLDLGETISFMKKENHSALVEARHPGVNQPLADLLSTGLCSTPTGG